MTGTVLDHVHSTATNQATLREAVQIAMVNYFRNLEGAEPGNIYDMVLTEVEAPLLEAVMEFTQHNQSRAAHIMGLNRGTLRKKLKRYGML